MFKDLLDPRLDAVFAPYCRALSAQELAGLHKSIDRHLELVQSALSHNEFIDVATARTLTHSLHHLLDLYPGMPEAQQRLVAGAAQYFTEAKDSQPDLTSILGFDDDVAVFNYVAAQIGRADLRIVL